jgi:hypothetical protein
MAPMGELEQLRAKLADAEGIIDVAALVVEGYQREAATDVKGDLVDLLADWSAKYD